MFTVWTQVLLQNSHLATVSTEHCTPANPPSETSSLVSLWINPGRQQPELSPRGPWCSLPTSEGVFSKGRWSLCVEGQSDPISIHD